MGLKIALSKVMHKNIIYIPKVVREILNINEGDYIAWYIKDNKVIIEKSKEENNNANKVNFKEKRGEALE